MKKKIFGTIYLAALTVLFISFQSCTKDEIVNVINLTTTVEVTAKDRLDSANAQATRKYGASTKLMLIMGRNVNAEGKTRLSALDAVANPDTISAWLYI